MNKGGSDREGKERIVGDVFKLEGWVYWVWRSGCVGGRCLNTLCRNVQKLFGGGKLRKWSQMHVLINYGVNG